MTDLADDLAWQIRAAGLPEPEREWRFHPERKWRMDLAWPDVKLCVECEGGVWSQGRHVRGQGFMADCEKYTEANLLGWWVYRIPGPWVEDGQALRTVEAALRKLGAIPDDG